LARQPLAALGLRLPESPRETPDRGAIESACMRVPRPGFLHFPDSQAALLREIETLLGKCSTPFLLLTPTGGFLSSQADAALKRASCATLALSATLEAEPGGRFRLKESIEPLLAEWARRMSGSRENTAIEGIRRELAAMRKGLADRPAPQEPPDENVARQAFALVQRLDTEQPLRPPTLLTVFRLYCVEDLSAGRIARKLRCSKPTILRRLARIRARTGVDPRDLRRLSPHLGKLEDDITDSRAKHIHRKSFIDDDADPDEM